MKISANVIPVKHRLLLFLLWGIVAFPAALLAQTTSDAVGTGTSWLLSARYGMGIWELSAPPDPNQTEFTADDCSKTYVRDSLEAINALQTMGTSTSEYQAALNWIEVAKFFSTDHLSQKALILSKVSSTLSSQVTTSLLSLRNSDGGFIGAAGYPLSDILDTALTLQAFNAANYSNTSLIGQALNYLTANQNVDGGWGFLPGQESTVTITATALKALSSYNSVFINQTAINNASVFLLVHQNSDGGFGSSPSKVYETSLALDALIASGANNISSVVANGVGYLTATQLADGSWNDDPYSTALALRALASARANLAVTSTDISLSKSMPQENESVTITATVHNTGFDSASGVIARFFLGDPAAGGTQLGVDQVIPTLTIGGSAQVSISAAFTGTGGKTIFVKVDPDNIISETNKADNVASTRIWVATPPDLAVFSEDLKSSTYVPAPNAAFTLAYIVRNLGESSTAGFDVALYDGNPASGGVLIQTDHVSGIDANATRMGTFGVTLSQSGSHTLYVVADSTNQITETTKTNNTGTVTIQVGGSITLADLVVTPADITLTPSRPHAGDLVQITANYRNQGTQPATNFLVEIFDGAPEAGGKLISSTTTTLAAGADQTITTNWTITPGIHNIYVILDRDNRIIETNENNNRSMVSVMADMVDIALSATDMTFNLPYPVVGDSVLLSVTVHNLGIKDTGGFNLALYDGDPNNSGTLLKTYVVGSMQGDSTTTISYTFTAQPWTYRFYAVADPENKVVELTKTNNMAIRSLTILGPGQTLGPDLVPTKFDLTGTTTDPQTLAISGPAQVTFQNKGDEKITTAFQVLVFEDMDNDGKYTAGVDPLLGTGKYAIAKFDDDPLSEFVLLITQVYSQALYMEGSVYLIEHDGKIKWGPVYLQELAPESPPASYKSAVITAGIDKEGKPEIDIRINEQSVKLDGDGYLKTMGK